MKVMIADDHGLVREGLTQLLKSMDEASEIIEAQTSQSILNYSDGNIDLLLLDLKMPGIENVKRVEYICDKLPTTAVIVVSAVESKHIASACIEAGAMGFIPKSSSNQVMKSAIQIVLSGEHYLPYTFSKQTEEQSDLPKDISPRQNQVWGLLVEGMTNKEIARELNLAEGTVKRHVLELFKNLNVHSRLAAVRKAKEIWG
jgi:DNA-binding NarL/FixJ family response regulator